MLYKNKFYLLVLFFFLILVIPNVNAKSLFEILKIPFYVYFMCILFPMFIFFITWMIFGKEYSRKKIGYFGIYERELPSEEDPVLANYYITADFSKNWFTSGIMYLVWKKHYEFSRNEMGELVICKTKKEINRKGFPYYAFVVFEFLNKNYPNGKINVINLKKQLSSSKRYTSADEFNIDDNLKNSLFKLNESTKEYYDLWFKSLNVFKDKGLSILIIFILFYTLILAILLYIFSNPFIDVFALVGFIFIWVFIISYKFFDYRLIFGKFTMEGRIKNLKWDAFKKYITTFSYIKEHPPESVIIWEQYIVYATAFGVANKTLRNTGIFEEYNIGLEFIDFLEYIK